MNRIPQVIYTNPSFIPDSRINVGLPFISSNYFSISNSGFTYNNLFNVDNLIKNMGKRNYFTTNLHIDFLSVGVALKDNYFSINITEKVSSRFTYPKALFQLVWEGNGQELLGTRANMDGLGYDFMHHREYAFGFARKFNDNLTFGARAKYLTGFQNIYTKTSRIGLTTDEVTFDLVADGEMQINTSGVKSIYEADGSYNGISAFKASGNNGVSLDLGGSFKYSDKIGFSIAVLDLGFINWKNDIKNYKQDEFEFVFRGVSLNELISKGDSTGETVIEALIDSLENTFVLDESEESYTTWLNTRILLGGTYKLTENHTAGALVYTEFIKGRMRSSLTLSMNTKIKKWLSASASYSMYNRSWTNIGLGFSVNAGPVQFYAVTDNVLAPIIPQAVKNAHIRFGLVATIGRKTKKAAATSID
ncbi:MAG: hypothetical protein H0V01_05035 [Bacteroidetes bacterium]|nr:hypothetical protein [Bacteroidota bacterium]HET6245752.1 DUF5723 family protein [Bacteroidia bacterium]